MISPYHSDHTGSKILSAGNKKKPIKTKTFLPFPISPFPRFLRPFEDFRRPLRTIEEPLLLRPFLVFPYLPFVVRLSFAHSLIFPIDRTHSFFTDRTHSFFTNRTHSLRSIGKFSPVGAIASTTPLPLPCYRCTASTALPPLHRYHFPATTTPMSSFQYSAKPSIHHQDRGRL